eukprot:2362807-Ditylum_brightwellii.AAC.1
MNDVAGWNPLGNHVSLPHSIPAGGASEVVPMGYSDGLSFGMIVGGLSEVDPVGNYVYLFHNRSNH